MRILITNAVPLNGGDEALLRATVETLTDSWPNSVITVLCSQLELCRKYLPDLHFASDLEFITDASEWDQVIDLYRNADVVLSAPGGFLHDHYSIEHRLRGFEVALDFEKPVVLFAQSIGPFWKPESLRRIPQVFNRLTSICVRDSRSTEHLIAAGVDPSKIHETADAAFLWRKLSPESFHTNDQRDGSLKKIGLCFRVWPLGDTMAVEGTIARAERLSRWLLTDPSRELVFISTCQGIPGYVDDSLLALQIVDRLPLELQSRCRVDRARYEPRRLMEVLGNCDAFIGMRLHGCILAMLAGTPAMGLGYEDKTAEIFRQLGLEPYQVNFQDEVETWLECAARFQSDLLEILARLPHSLDRLCRRAESSMDVIEIIEKAMNQNNEELQSSTDQYPDERSQSTNRAVPEYFGAMTSKDWRQDVSLALEEARDILPSHDAFILVDDGQFGIQSFGDRRAIPFLEHDGEYWGAPPDDETAIRELERLRETGAGFMVFGWPAFWWLDYYTGLHRHLRMEARCLLESDRLIVFDLQAPTIGSTQLTDTRKDNSSSSDRIESAYDVIHQVLSDNLTYLNYRALVDLVEAVRELDRHNLHGAIIETGCALGGSALTMASAKASTRPFYVYDVFGMIPGASANDGEEGQMRYELISSGQSKGIRNSTYYGYETNLYEKVKSSFDSYGIPVEDNSIQLVKGLYQDTLQVNEDVALAHIDCDWFESVMTCLQRIEPHLVIGGTLIIDDYYRWPGCRRAVDEYFSTKRTQYSFTTKARLHIKRLV
jgi:polysaccharide pyruvyl transferase WcaK-like protein